MSSKQPMPTYWNDPAYLRTLADLMRVQQTVVMRQWETLMASPVPPVINPVTPTPIVDPVDVGEPADH